MLHCVFDTICCSMQKTCFCILQAEGDEVAAKLLATRRETMRLRNKIRELKQQHADLQQMKQAQQRQLASAGTLESHSTQTDLSDLTHSQDEYAEEVPSKVDSSLAALVCDTASDRSEQSSADIEL